MDSTDSQVLEAVCRWAETGRHFTLVTVARTWGSAPRPAGSLMAINDLGQVQGSVSGGCIEQNLIERILSGEFDSAAPLLQKYGVTSEEANRFGLPCGGIMELVIEPKPDLELLKEISVRIKGGQLVRRTVRIGQPGCSIDAGSATDALHWDGHMLMSVHGPAWRLLIVGAGQIGGYLAQMAQALDYQVTVCDPRQEYISQWAVCGTTVMRSMPDDTVNALNLDPHSAVVALTHDPKLDDMALLEALKSPAFYVGALGSIATSARRRERLLQYFDLTAEEVARLHGPVGLPIGSRTPPEIAVAIVAEMTAVRNGAFRKEKRNCRLPLQAGCPVT